jgi:hypothetical protein
VWGATRGTYDDKVRPGGILTVTRFVRAGALGAGFGPVVSGDRKARKEGKNNGFAKHAID